MGLERLQTDRSSSDEWKLMIDTLQYEDRKAAYFTLGCKLNLPKRLDNRKALLERGIRKGS